MITDKELHILKFTPFNVPITPHNMPLYHDVYSFFKNYFRQQMNVAICFYSPEELIEDIAEEFGKTHELVAVTKMLQMGYEYVPETGRYMIERKDFYLQKTV